MVLLLREVRNGRLHVDGHEVAIRGVISPLHIDVLSGLECPPEGIVVALSLTYGQLLAREAAGLAVMCHAPVFLAVANVGRQLSYPSFYAQ